MTARKRWFPRCDLRVILVCVFVLGTALSPADARAAFGISSFDGAVLDTNGNAFTQAGGHPADISTHIAFNRVVSQFGEPMPDGGNVKDLFVDLPAGLVGNPQAAPQCEGFLTNLTDLPCPNASQVGVVTVEFSFGPVVLPFMAPLYNLTPSHGVAATFGFKVLQFPVLLNATVRTEGDYGITFKADDTSQALTLLGVTVAIWGTPADSAHDSQRGPCLGNGGTDPATGSPCPSDLPRVPFITNPTSCTRPGVGLRTDLKADSWKAPGVFATSHFESHVPPGYPLPVDQWGTAQGPTGCEAVPFEPSLDLDLDTGTPDSPTGLNVELRLNDEGLSNPEGIAASALRQARVTLPEGFSVSPSAALGLASCSDAEAGLRTNQPARCPAASKIGTVEADTPVLKDRLLGGIFVGQQKSLDPESGEMFRIILTLESSERGIFVKLEGKVRADEGTGQLTAIFDSNPQLPVSRIALQFDGGPSAALATPDSCGTKRVMAELTSWSGARVALSEGLDIACTQPPGLFDPSFVGGANDPIAGVYSPVAVGVKRPDATRAVEDVRFRLPIGITARLRGVALCPAALASAGDCPAESQIGTAAVSAGPGPRPFSITGQVSLSGPYRGAPYGLVTTVRAVAGPFDLGKVTVRQAVTIDPTDAHIEVISDKLPLIVKGVPLRIRSIDVRTDRPTFTKNATSCSRKRLEATLISDIGQTAERTMDYRLSDCQALGFKPRLSFRLVGRKQTDDGEHPGFRAVVTQGTGEASLKSVRVELPLSVALDPANSNSNGLCTFEVGQDVTAPCPRSSVIGRAHVVTPLLERPLTGNVHLVKNVRIDKRTGRRIRTLPTLLIPLRGEVAINVRATTSVSDGRLVSRFTNLPDAPIQTFRLALKGGRKGILVVTGGDSLCKRRQMASVAIAGHNGALSDRRLGIRTPCKR